MTSNGSVVRGSALAPAVIGTPYRAEYSDGTKSTRVVLNLPIVLMDGTLMLVCWRILSRVNLLFM